MPLHGMGHRIEFYLVSNAGAAEGGSFSTRRERVERPEMGFDCLINPQDMKRPKGWARIDPLAVERAARRAGRHDERFRFGARAGYGSDQDTILLANSILDRTSSEVVVEGESDVGVVDRLGVIPILDLRKIAMSLQPQEIAPVPEETQRVARAAFPKGKQYPLIPKPLPRVARG